MNKILYRLTLVIVIISSICLYSCDDEKDIPAPDFISFSTADNTTYLRNAIKVSAEPEFLTLRLGLYSGDENVDFTNITDAQRKAYDAIELAAVETIYGVEDYTSTSISWKNSPFEQSGNNTWEADGVTIKKSQKDGYVYMEIALSSNNSDKLKNYKISFVGNPKNQSSWCIGELYIQQAAGTLTFKGRYKKQTYISEIEEDENGNLIYKDEATRNLIERLNSLDGVETVVANDMVYFFDAADLSADTSLRKLCRNESSPMASKAILVNTRASVANAFSYRTANALGYGILFDDTNFEDTRIYKNLTESFYDLWEETDLKSLGMNDKPSSLAVGYYGDDAKTTCVLTVWEDKDFNFGDNDRTKHRMSFVASVDAPTLAVANLKKIPCIGSSNSWNDRISSFSLHFGNYGINLKDY